MWIGICEDTAEDRVRLEKDVQSLAQPSDRVTAYANGSELLDAVYTAGRQMDMLLLDIEMPALSGIDTALELQKVSPSTQIIIITKFKEYALKGYEIRPSNYLLKPVSVNELRVEIDRARLIAGDVIGETLFIKGRDTVAFVPLKDILYIECFDHTLHVHAVTAKYKYQYRLGSLDYDLTDKGFCCIHKSFLVNFRHVERIDRTNRTAMLDTGETVPVSKHRITDVLTAFTRYRQSTLPESTAPEYTGAATETHSVSRSLAGTFG
jgi:DNA-binding LytR/AlgR family response regulator